MYPSDALYQYGGVSVSEWAKTRYASFTTQRLDSYRGNRCGYSIRQNETTCRLETIERRAPANDIAMQRADISWSNSDRTATRPGLEFFKRSGDRSNAGTRVITAEDAVIDPVAGGRAFFSTAIL